MQGVDTDELSRGIRGEGVTRRSAVGGTGVVTVESEPVDVLTAASYEAGSAEKSLSRS